MYAQILVISLHDNISEGECQYNNCPWNKIVAAMCICAFNIWVMYENKTTKTDAGHIESLIKLHARAQRIYSFDLKV